VKDKEEQPEYRLDRVPEVNQQIRDLVAKATPLGTKQQLLDALKEIVAKLTSQPLDWGDPDYNTKKPGGQVCHAILEPLIVHYVVFESDRVVILLKIKPLPGSSLE